MSAGCNFQAVRNVKGLAGRTCFLSANEWRLAGRRRFLSATNGGWQEGDASCQLRMAADRKEALPVSNEWQLAGRGRFLSIPPGSCQEGCASCKVRMEACRKSALPARHAP